MDYNLEVLLEFLTDEQKKHLLLDRFLTREEIIERINEE